VRKRDPRYKAHLKRQAQSPTPTPAITAAGTTTTPKRTAPTSTFVVQDWQKVAEPEDATADLEWARAEGTDDEEWECVACNKTFRSEAAWNSHERSKKHLRTVEQLKREMQDEELELELGQENGEFADADAKDPEEVDGQVTGSAAAATADVIVDEKASPDPVMSAPEDTIEAQDPHRPGRRKQTQKKSHIPSSLDPSPAPSVPKASQIGAARRSSQTEEGDPELPEQTRETLDLHYDEGLGNDEGAEAGAANSTKVEMSKREKRRAREAAKKAREGESKGGCAVSFLLAQILFNSPPCWEFLTRSLPRRYLRRWATTLSVMVFFFGCHPLVIPT
jgi:DnaJ family protein A protein 5